MEDVSYTKIKLLARGIQVTTLHMWDKQKIYLQIF